MVSRSSFAFLLVALAAAAAAASAFSPEKARGIAPEDLKYYQGSSISCKDKSKKFSLSRLNDNFCDCPDGTDEPGTSACPEGRFYCKNTGDAPKLLFSSRVNDGICDCCDGSDEYDGQVKCPDTCWEAGRKAREKLEKKVAMFREGSRLRALDVENSKQLRKKDESELAALKKEEKSYKPVVDRLKAQVDAIEEVERLDRERREKEEQELKSNSSAPFPDTPSEDPAQAEGESTREEAEFAKELDVSIDSEQSADEAGVHEEVETLPKSDQGEWPVSEDVGVESNAAPSEEAEPVVAVDKEDSEKLEELSKEELGRLVASRWTGERDAKVAETENVDPVEPGDNEKDDEDEDETYPSTQEPNGVDHENEDEYIYDEHSYDAGTEEAKASYWVTILRPFRAILKLLGLEKKLNVDMSEADAVRSEYREANAKLSKIRSKVSELENKLKQDFGKDGQFYSLYERCFEKQQNKYLYKVCPYKNSNQEEGHQSTRLGVWNGFKHDHKYMDFSGGDHCWNGPDRSLEVRMKCGVTSELSEVEEPSRCEYSATLSTPALCSDERTKALQDQLDGLYSAATPAHEEL